MRCCIQEEEMKMSIGTIATSVMRALGILDDQDMYMKQMGGVKKLRVVGSGMLEQDVSEIYKSESYQKAQRQASRVLSKNA
jgi:ribonucleotide reductase alpha subunit